MSHGLIWFNDDFNVDELAPRGVDSLGIDKQTRMCEQAIDGKRHEPSSEDHFDNWIDRWDTPQFRAHQRKWDRVKQEAAKRHYEQVRLYRMPVDSYKLRGDLKTAIQKTNEWLERNSAIGYPDSPVNVFINFFKKEVRHDKTIDKVIRGNSINLDYSKGYVSSLSFYDTYWPTWAMGFYRELNAQVKQIDYDALRSESTATATETAVMSMSISAAMAPGLSKLSSFTF